MKKWTNELSYAGYHREAHRFAERFVELDPLSSVAHYSLGETLYATGHTTEAMAPLAFAWESNNEYAKWFVPAVHLAQKRDDSAIAQTEAGLERDGISDSSWVRDLVAGARDPVNGQAYLDRRIPQIIASMPDEYAGEWQNALTLWYLLFGFVDRYYELISKPGLTLRSGPTLIFMCGKAPSFATADLLRIRSISKHERREAWYHRAWLPVMPRQSHEPSGYYGQDPRHRKRHCLHTNS